MPPALRRPPYVAYLRVFEPVEHLPPAARERWTAYAASRPGRRLVEAAAFEDAVRRLAGRPPVPVPPAESDDALFVERDGALYVCPQQPRLSVWAELGAGDAALPPVLGQPLPPALREQAAADLADHVRGGGELRLFTRTTTWQVPVAWFVPFGPDERDLELGGGARDAGCGGDATERSLRYRTSMSSARRRCARGLRTSREHLQDEDVVQGIEQVARWLEQFDPRSLVELDYGALVDLVDDVHLQGDDSAADVADGLAALAEGDASSAAAAYRRWTRRWSRLALLAAAS